MSNHQVAKIQKKINFIKTISIELNANYISIKKNKKKN